MMGQKIISFSRVDDMSANISYPAWHLPTQAGQAWVHQGSKNGAMPAQIV